MPCPGCKRVPPAHTPSVDSPWKGKGKTLSALGAGHRTVCPWMSEWLFLELPPLLGSSREVLGFSSRGETESVHISLLAPAQPVPPLQWLLALPRALPHSSGQSQKLWPLVPCHQRSSQSVLFGGSCCICLLALSPKAGGSHQGGSPGSRPLNCSGQAAFL